MKPRRFFLLLTIIVLFGAFAFLVVTQRPTLVNARNAADSSFSDLRPTLETRYETVPAILDALKTAGSLDRAPSLALANSQSAWVLAHIGDDANRLSDAANLIEGNVARVRAMYLGSDRLREFSAQIEPALKAFDATLTPTAELQIKKNAEAVASYRAKRGAWLSKPVIFVGGFGERITYEPVRTQPISAPAKPATP